VNPYLRSFELAAVPDHCLIPLLSLNLLIHLLLSLSLSLFQPTLFSFFIAVCFCLRPHLELVLCLCIVISNSLIHDQCCGMACRKKAQKARIPPELASYHSELVLCWSLACVNIVLHGGFRIFATHLKEFRITSILTCH
jgi:hypothetical protein